MNRPLDRLARPMGLAALVIGPASLCASAPAHADTRAGVDTSAGLIIESNPYLEGGNRGDVAATVDVSPWFELSDSVTSATLSGSLQVSKYSRSVNGTNISGTASLDVQRRMSSYVSVNAGVTYMTSRNGGIAELRPLGPDDPLPPPTAPLPDFSLVGTRATTHSVSASAGVGVRLSSLDQLSVNASATRSSNNLAGSTDFNYLNGGLSYSRTLSPHTSVSTGIQVGRSDYPGTSVGDGTIISPDIGVQTVLGRSTTLSASIGASFSRTTRLDGVREKLTALSGRLQACRTLRNGSLCANAAQAVQPTAFGTISKVTSASLGYDTRISRRDTIGFNIGLNRVSNDSDLESLSIPRSFKYYSAGANLSHNFGRRLFGSASASYTRVDDTFKSTNGFTLALRLQYRFGAIS